jgi:large subunit ribosomal protein L15
MIALNTLKSIGPKGLKRRGQGIGSGKGSHTSGRGQKGQKSRGRIGLLFEGTKTKKSLIKRLPLLRGKGKFQPKSDKPVAVNLDQLNQFSAGSEVTIDSLTKLGIIRSGHAKILGTGDIKISLRVRVPVSKSAAAKITKAGGQVLTQ